MKAAATASKPPNERPNRVKVSASFEQYNRPRACEKEVERLMSMRVSDVSMRNTHTESELTEMETCERKTMEG